ncbi:E3 ubiquitin ligase complex SCF subunit sconC [Phycomyces nitens]|nr:E3 ubiquitin ligase complex SCF subunit sconC [Phycomyces nitens]
MPEVIQETNEPIKFPDVNPNIWKKVDEWCEYHNKDPFAQNDQQRSEMDIEEWDQNYINVDQDSLFDIILVAHYLKIKPLVDLGCKTVANIIKHKSAREIRRTFNMVNDFSEEEQAQIRRENEYDSNR